MRRVDEAKVTSQITGHGLTPTPHQERPITTSQTPNQRLSVGTAFRDKLLHSGLSWPRQNIQKVYPILSSLSLGVPKSLKRKRTPEADMLPMPPMHKSNQRLRYLGWEEPETTSPQETKKERLTRSQRNCEETQTSRKTSKTTEATSSCEAKRCCKDSRYAASTL